MASIMSGQQERTLAPQRVEIIAECGVNHNGSADMALRLVEAAAGAGATVVKFQTFSAQRLATPGAGRSGYQVRNTGEDGSQLEMLRALELDERAHHRLLSACRDLGVEFLSSPFDEESATFLVQDLGLKRLKLGSGELASAPFLLHCARLGVPIILSTGMATCNIS